MAAETAPIELSSEAVALLSVSPALPGLIANAVAEALSQNRRVDGIATTLSAFTSTGSVTLSLKQVLIDWRQSEVVKGERVQQRNSWIRLDCLVVRKKDAKKLEQFLCSKSLINSDKLPKLALSTGTHLGE